MIRRGGLCNPDGSWAYDPIPLSVHLFVKELRKYKCPLAIMTVSIDECEQKINIVLTGNALGKSFEARHEYQFRLITEWSKSKAVDMAYYTACNVYIECVKGCLKASRKEAK